MDLFSYKQKNNKENEDIELLRGVYYNKIYGYGNHFPQNSCKLLHLIKTCILTCILFFLSKFQLKTKTKTKTNILCSGYFGVHHNFEQKGINAYRPFWSSHDFRRWKFDIKILYSYLRVQILFSLSGINDLESKKSMHLIKMLKERFRNWLVENNVKGVVLPGDTEFYSKLCISLCKELNIPTFIFIHGIPAIYYKYNDNSTDYIVVWSDRIKKEYVNCGFAEDKIIVSGRPQFSGKMKQNIKFCLDDILVCTKGLNQIPYYINENVIISDRGNTFLYLEDIKKALLKIGIKKVRLRNHPGESSEWYIKHIDNNFFEIDRLKLDDSLKKSTLVIGPTSTLLFDVVSRGINYLAYEPEVNGNDLYNYPIAWPFVKTNDKIPLARNEKELLTLLNENSTIDNTIIDDLVADEFDISHVVSIIKDNK